MSIAAIAVCNFVLLPDVPRNLELGLHVLPLAVDPGNWARCLEGWHAACSESPNSMHPHTYCPVDLLEGSGGTMAQLFCWETHITMPWQTSKLAPFSCHLGCIGATPALCAAGGLADLVC